MKSISASVTRTSRSIRRATKNLFVRLTRKASLKLALTISLPPFVKLAIDYKADPSKPENAVPKPANDNKPRRRTQQRA